MINAGGAIVHAGALVDAPNGGVQAALTCRGPGRLYAYCQPPPSRVALDGADAPLAFTHDAASGTLEVVLPDDAPTAELTVFWSLDAAPV